MSAADLTPIGALTEQEQALVARIFSDPFYFPLQFKTWLQWFVENVQGNVAGGSIASPGVTSDGRVPIGGMVLCGTPTLPVGHLWCDGAAYGRSDTTYNQLYKAVGTTWGAGDGSTSFNVPDVVGRMLVGWGVSGGHADVATVGANEGAAKANRRPKHQTSSSLSVSLNDPGHGHRIKTERNFPNGGNRAYQETGSADYVYDTYPEGIPPEGIEPSLTGITAALAGGVGSGNGNDSLDTSPYLIVPVVIRYV